MSYYHVTITAGVHVTAKIEAHTRVEAIRIARSEVMGRWLNQLPEEIPSCIDDAVSNVKVIFHTANTES